MDSVIFLVAHPDDDTYNVGGLMLMMKGKYDVHVICATKGERGVRGQSLEQTRDMRLIEHKNALAITGGTNHYLDVVDGELIANEETIQKTLALYQQIKPRAIFAHWPVDNHMDHSAAGELALKAYRKWGVKAEFYYFEGYLGQQTSDFHPQLYVDITDVWDTKLEAVRCHVCQNPDDSMAQYMELQCRVRGLECGAKYAEGYIPRYPLTNKSKSILFEI